MEIGAQGIGENDDRCEQRLSEHDGRFPEDESLSVGAVQEASDVVDHPVRVVVLRVLDDDVADGQMKSEREEDEQGPSQETAQMGVGSLVASNTGRQPLSNLLSLFTRCASSGLFSQQRVLPQRDDAFSCTRAITEDVPFVFSLGQW